MNHVHGPHGATGIVENPLLVEVHVGLSGGRLQVCDDVRDDGAGVVAVLGDGALGEAVQLRWLEDVEALEVRFQEDVDAVQQGGERHEQGD